MERFTHSGRLERWLGTEATEHLSQSMKDWYGPPVAVAGVPGRVFAMPGGEFRGPIRAGQFANGLDYAAARLPRIINRWAGRQMSQANAGFASLSDLIAEATAGKRIEFSFNKAGPTGVVGVTSSLWGVGAMPAAGASGSAAPGGRAPTDATTGAIPFTNPTGGDTLHIASAFPASALVGTLLLYDRIFDVLKTMNSSATESVTGVPTRYQGTTGGAADSAEGNFLFVEVGGTALAATGHNWTTCLYTDQSGNASATLPSLTGNSAAIVRRLDHPVMQWFAPLASDDTGIQQLDQMQCSAAVATGVVNFVIGHPLCWMPIPIINMVCVADYVNTAFSIPRIFDDAALAFLDVHRVATGTRDYSGTITCVAG